jgi:hypothetical protein
MPEGKEVSALIALNLFGACVNGGVGTNFLTILGDAPAGERTGPEHTGGPRRCGERQEYSQ